MNNLTEVNDDILKDWLDFREEELCSLTCDEDRKHHIYFDEISARILKRIPNEDKNMLKSNLVFLMRILWIISIIGTRSIIGMGFVMEWSWLVDVVTIMFHFKVQILHFKI